MKDEVKSAGTDDEEKLDMTNYGCTNKDDEPTDKKEMAKYL